MLVTPDLEAAILRTIFETGKYLRGRAHTSYSVEDKDGKGDIVTELDKEAERRLKHSFRDMLGNTVNLVGEESEADQNDSDVTIYIDPIDGTKSFANRDFTSSTTIAIETPSGLEFSCVNDFMKGIMYVGSNGRLGFYRDGEEIQSYEPPSLAKPRISIDHDIKKVNRYLAGRNQEFSIQQQQGSIALNMARTAFGDFSGIVMEDGLGGIWDYAPGHHLLQCKGVSIFDTSGNELHTVHDYRISPAERRGLIAFHPSFEEKYQVLDRIFEMHR